MPDPPSPPNDHQPVTQWEGSFGAAGQVLAGPFPAVREPWGRAYVHVARGLRPPDEPVESGGLDTLQIVAYESPSWVREYLPGRAPHIEGVVRPGDFTVASPEMSHLPCHTLWRGELSFTSVMLPAGLLGAAAVDLDVDPAAVGVDERHGVRDELVSSCVRALAQEVASGGQGGRVYAEQLLHTIALHLIARHASARRSATRATGGLAPRLVARVTEYIEAYLASAISLHDLAAVAGLSTWHFARQFRRATGKTPAAHVRDVRLARARDLLAQPASTHWSVGEVAAAVGYTAAAAFSTAFRRAYGISPRELRRA